MNCNKCSAWSNVLETRRNADGSVVHRRHRCANEHVFWSVQTFSASKLSDRRAKAAQRNAEIVAAVHAGEQRKIVAARYGLNKKTVYDIMQKAKS